MGRRFLANQLAAQLPGKCLGIEQKIKIITPSSVCFIRGKTAAPANASKLSYRSLIIFQKGAFYKVVCHRFYVKSKTLTRLTIK